MYSDTKEYLFQDTLFPFSVEHAEKYITANWDRNETQDAVNALIQQAKIDIKNNIEGIVPISEEVCKPLDKNSLQIRYLFFFYFLGN